jgi:putative oxidoreductase
MNVGLLLVRIVVGALFIGHGTQKLFRWFGGHGLEGTGGFLAQLGYPRPKESAVLAGLAEAGGGALLLLGLLTPLGAAGILGVMVNAAGSVHAKNGLWNTNGGYELPLVFATAAVALAFAGPGAWSLDRAFGWHLTGWPWGLVAIALGIISGVVLLSVRRASSAEEAGEEGGRRAA